MRALSSRFTFFAKYVAPVLWIAGVGLLTLRAFLHPPSPIDSGIAVTALNAIKWLLLIAWSLGSVDVVRHAIPLRRVRVDGDFLLISDYFREVRVPIEELVDIYQDKRSSTITLGFKGPSPLAGIVKFIPARPRDLLVWRDDHAAEELRRLAHFDADS